MYYDPQIDWRAVQEWPNSKYIIEAGE